MNSDNGETMSGQPSPYSDDDATRRPEWIRYGECNQCGDCCRQATNLIQIVTPIQDEPYGRARYGEPVGYAPGPMPLFAIRGPILMPCPKIDGDRCSIHAAKPQTCQDSPLTPADIEGTRCSYWFVHRDTGEVRNTVHLGGDAGAQQA
jgi:Fe-S-cluster containining protein